MSGLLGLRGKKPEQAQAAPAVAGLQLQSSTYGKVIPIVYGRTRVAPNLIWYNDFRQHAHAQAPAGGGGGKGGVVGGGGGGKGGSGGGGTTYTYDCAVILALCEGQIAGIGTVWASKTETTLSALNLNEFNGSFTQSAWPYVETTHPDEARPYSGIAYVAGAPYDLGSSAQLPNHNFEVFGRFQAAFVAGVPDADPSQVVFNLLADRICGAGFPEARIGDFTDYRNYCGAVGLWISPAYTEQIQASQALAEIAKNTNAEFVFSSGVLRLVPYGAQSKSANGYTYTAPSAGQYSLNDDDYIITSDSEDPVTLTRKRPADQINTVQLEVLNRANKYNPSMVEATDQAAADTYGRRTSGSQQAHMFCDMNAGKVSAQLQLSRQGVRNTYTFTLDGRYVLLDPLDLVGLTDSNLGLNNTLVSINSIQENDDGTFTFEAEEWPLGTGAPPRFDFNDGQGFSVDYNAEAPSVNIPQFFEPPYSLAGALEVWAAVSGPNANWGACDVYISTDGATFQQAGHISYGARMGTIENALPAATQDYDQSNTANVNLTESRGTLVGADVDAALAGGTISLIGNELLSYVNANLLGTNRYALSQLIRGQYGTDNVAHLAGERFIRLDEAIFKIPFTANQIGQTIYVKFCSYNQFGGGLQSLADAKQYSYKITGAALLYPPADIPNFRSVFIGTFTHLTWDEITDFRVIQYELRKGPTWEQSQFIARQAHPPFMTQGDGTYWIAAVAEPVPDRLIYSETPVSIVITGSALATNVLESWDEGATGWTGTLGGSAVIISGNVETSYDGNFLDIADFLAEPDLLNSGSMGNGSYELPSGHWIDQGRVQTSLVLIDYTSFGVSPDEDFLSANDFLGMTDLLIFGLSGAVNVYPEIALSQDGTTYAAYQKYTTGAYTFKKVKVRMQLESLDGISKAVLDELIVTVDVPDRVDHYMGQSIAAGGTTITFTPNGGSPTPFNGGPNAAVVPLIQVNIRNAAAGDTPVISSLTLTSVNVRVFDSGGTGVARTCDIVAQGY